jgi:uncharacterized protein (TIGR03083 family)
MLAVPPTVDELLRVLRTSHNQLAATAAKLDAADVAAPSYCTDWNRAQVLSHLGSGAEIGLATLRAALGAGPAPEPEKIWDRWNALPPEEMARGFVEHDDLHLTAMEQLDAGQRETLRLPFFLGPIPVDAALTFRLHEHVQHNWDVQVSLDPRATLLPDAVPLLLALPPTLARFSARPAQAALPGPIRLAINTTDPERHYLLTVTGDQAELAETDAAPADLTGTLDLPAEAFLRLGSGRLDPDHTPTGVHAEGQTTLDDLRKLFPGY